MELNKILKDLENSVSSSSNLLVQKQKDYQNLTQAWINERAAPELLPYESLLVNTTLERLKDQIEIIEMNSIELQIDDHDIKLKLLIIENEIERVNYVIRSYLRCRLAKIDRYSLYLSENPHLLGNLSSPELAYMSKHLKLLDTLYNNSFMSSMPDHLKSTTDPSGGISMAVEPNINKFVFVKVLKSSPTPLQLRQHEIELEKGDVHAIQWKYVRGLVANHHMCLL